MKTFFATAALAATLFAAPAFAAGRASISEVKSNIKTEAAGKGVNDVSKVTVNGNSYKVFVKSTFNGTPTPGPVHEQLVGEGTVNRDTGKVTSYKPVELME